MVIKIEESFQFDENLYIMFYIRDMKTHKKTPTYLKVKLSEKLRYKKKNNDLEITSRDTDYVEVITQRQFYKALYKIYRRNRRKLGGK